MYYKSFSDKYFLCIFSEQNIQRLNPDIYYVHIYTLHMYSHKTTKLPQNLLTSPSPLQVQYPLLFTEFVELLKFFI
jgi:hypothetical protein